MKLHTYSSGSGCLSISWRTDTNECSSRKVTKTDAKRCLASKSKTHLRDRGWQVMWDGSFWKLVFPWIRLDANTIESKEWGIVKIDKWDATSFHWPECSFQRETNWYPLKNQNALMTIVYFLRNEQWITEQNSALITNPVD